MIDGFGKKVDAAVTDRELRPAGMAALETALPLPVAGAAVFTVDRCRVSMPTISRFYGIVVYMNYNDHAPLQFHARYQEQEVAVEIESQMVTGSMSRRALKLVFDWADQHRDELLRNRELARQRQAT